MVDSHCKLHLPLQAMLIIVMNLYSMGMASIEAQDAAAFLFLPCDHATYSHITIVALLCPRKLVGLHPSLQGKTHKENDNKRKQHKL